MKSALKIDESLTHATSISGYLALIDLGSFDKCVGALEIKDLMASAVRQMQLERIFAWGCPEGNFKIQITTQEDVSFRSVESTEGAITTTGKLCLTSYGNLLQAAQLPDSPFPQIENTVFSDAPLSIAPGRYSIRVHCMFKWDHQSQYAEELNEGHNYVIVLQPIASLAKKKSHQKIPWAFTSI
jgi:hypothetical protein